VPLFHVSATGQHTRCGSNKNGSLTVKATQTATSTSQAQDKDVGRQSLLLALAVVDQPS